VVQISSDDDTPRKKQKEPPNEEAPKTVVEKPKKWDSDSDYKMIWPETKEEAVEMSDLLTAMIRSRSGNFLQAEIELRTFLDQSCPFKYRVRRTRNDSDNNRVYQGFSCCCLAPLCTLGIREEGVYVKLLPTHEYFDECIKE
jgi:hypothetical protein